MERIPQIVVSGIVIQQRDRLPKEVVEYHERILKAENICPAVVGWLGIRAVLDYENPSLKTQGKIPERRVVKPQRLQEVSKE